MGIPRWWGVGSVRGFESEGEGKRGGEREGGIRDAFGGL